MNEDEAPGGAETAVYEADILADLAELFGKDRLAELLGGLDEEIVHRLGSATPDLEGLGAHAHALVSVSGTLGFSSLSQACATLEHACLNGGDVIGPLHDARTQAARARHAIARLRTEDI